MFAITGQFVTSQVGWIIKIARAFRTFIIYSLMFLFVTPQRRMGTESRFRTVCVCLDEFYFRWLEKDIMGIVKVVINPCDFQPSKMKTLQVLRRLLTFASFAFAFAIGSNLSSVFVF